MIENLYPTPIYSAMVDNFDDIQKEMYSTISNLDFKMVEEWGQTHFVSSSTFNDSYKMKVFEDELHKHIVNYCLELEFPIRNYKLKSWFTKFKKGNYGHIHSHGHHDISVCYYVKTKESSGSIFFETPVESATTSFVYNKKYANRYWHMPIEGKLLLFPAWLRHGITTNTTDKERISFSANIEFKR